MFYFKCQQPDTPAHSRSLQLLRNFWYWIFPNHSSFPNNCWDTFVKRKDHLLITIDIKYQIWKFVVIFTDNNFLYLVWYLVMSLLGHYNNFFFASQLLDIAMGVKTQRTILSSVTHNGKQLRMTMVGLLAVVVYLYTVVAFFCKFYNMSEDEDEPDMKCDDMMTYNRMKQTSKSHKPAEIVSTDVSVSDDVFAVRCTVSRISVGGAPGTEEKFSRDTCLTVQWRD
ncbi:hypothetical protein SKAU_G00087150 [Synaphobranchus kaupii]|uniref:Uncharacterized protein n=1 Tax=Synaphobranchus kaupii TaxID=118154 RepID=A0A9Q1J514_SYNKA|nr:hypothetical protein SKAU_G00087150 [Synaphobranchus kaupii]